MKAPNPSLVHFPIDIIQIYFILANKYDYKKNKKDSIRYDDAFWLYSFIVPEELWVKLDWIFHKNSKLRGQDSNKACSQSRDTLSLGIVQGLSVPALAKDSASLLRSSRFIPSWNRNTRPHVVSRMGLFEPSFHRQNLPIQHNYCPGQSQEDCRHLKALKVLLDLIFWSRMDIGSVEINWGLD